MESTSRWKNSIYYNGLSIVGNGMFQFYEHSGDQCSKKIEGNWAGKSDGRSQKAN